ncbi:rhodanese-like domain-containing protein [Azospirillum sp. TSA2s]|uniref:rhodanese-like domain-containing protein n=1 Tax=Azospirillum sp. TSA2s TaxID=709810 RepID=UPI0010AA4425|nr:rhodanese-like domain-containing protein [Azospirillum sp. TSA2s]QCG98522.1 rhodanese-like domain-containing protein [Azospirillum sp. TSA2s]
MPSLVTEIPAAPSEMAAAHFAKRLSLETDCWDVHETLKSGTPDFILLDVRSPAAFARGRLPGALNLPHGKITERRMADWPEGTLFVVYCAGPHCNGADRAALRLARIGRPVKLMIGGITGWIAEGFALECET